ncbi:MAG: hypothetical protein ACP5C3_01085 [Methanomicrobiales archaeon]
MINVIEERLGTAQETECMANARILAEKIANNINLVHAAGEGHKINMSLPSHIGGQDYKVKVNSSGVYIYVDGKMGRSSIIPQNIVDNLPPESTQIILYPGNSYTICNSRFGENSNCIIIN